MRKILILIIIVQAVALMTMRGIDQNTQNGLEMLEALLDQECMVLDKDYVVCSDNQLYSLKDNQIKERI